MAKKKKNTTATERISIQKHTDEGNAQKAKLEELKQSSQEGPFEASRHDA